MNGAAAGEGAGPAREALFGLAQDLDGLSSLARCMDEKCRRGAVDARDLEAAMVWLEDTMVQVRRAYADVQRADGAVFVRLPLARMGGRTRGA
jgi:hypothetical protein